MRATQRAQLDDFLARLPEGTRALRLTRFRRATLGSNLGDFASHFIPFGGDETAAPGDSRPFGLTLSAHDGSGAALATRELHPLPGADDDAALHACVLRARERELTIDVFAEARHLERLGATSLELQPVDEGARHDSTAEADVFTYDLTPRPPVWMRLVVGLFTVALLPVLLAALVIRPVRDLWQRLLLPMLWPRRMRWTLRLAPDGVSWSDQPGWAPTHSGAAPRAAVLAVSVAPDAWTANGPGEPTLRLVTTTSTVRIPTAPSGPLTRLAATRLVALDSS